MSGRFTRRVVVVGSAGAFWGLAVRGYRRKRALTGVHIGDQAGVVDMAFLRNGVHAVAADTTPEGTINVWDLRARKIARSFRVGRPISHLTLDEERGLLAAAWYEEGQGRSSIGLFDFATGRQVRLIEEGAALYGVDGLFVAREGLLSCYADRAIRSESTLWSFETGREIAHFGRPAEAIAADGRTVLGGRVIWDLVSGRIRGELVTDSRVWGHAISADGSRAVSERRHEGILWNKRGELVRRLDDQINAIATAAFSPDDRFLITSRHFESFRGDHRLLVLRDGQTGQLLAELRGHTSRYVRGIAFSPNGAFALSGGGNGELILWTMPGGGRR